MNWNWRHYAAAAVIVGAALLKGGAPLLTVLAGIAAVAAVGVMSMRRAR